jgi:16S rRNA (uracil1498-N3)-methyltransferase
MPITAFADVVARVPLSDLRLIPALIEERRVLRDVVRESKPKDTVVLIGPEGDFSPQEVALAVSSGFVPVSLGRTVLRVGMAAVTAAAFIRLAWSED